MGEAADDKPRVPRPGGTPPSRTAHDGSSPPRRSERPSARPGGAKALVGAIISDRYRVERLLGEGGMGAVYQVEHTGMRKRMAIKVLHPEMTRMPEVVARFENEAMAAAHIEHPNVVAATDFGKLEDGSFFIALEFVEGKTLRDVVGEGRVELGRALHIVRQVASALQRAHALGIVHRDLKPENVMLVDRDGDPDFAKVLDFGIAKVPVGEIAEAASLSVDPRQPVLTQAGMVYGTPEYMAPEQALGQPVDARADLYALGIIMFELLAGVRPFEAESKVALLGMQVTAPVPALAAKAPGLVVPPEVESLIGRLLAKEADNRMADARELIDGVVNALALLAASGQIDPKYANAASGGRATNPGINSSLTPALSGPQLPSATAPTEAGAPAVGAMLGGRAWIIAAAAGTIGLLVLVTVIVVVLRGRDRGQAIGGGDAGTQTASSDAGEVLELTQDEEITAGIAMIKQKDYASGIRKLEELPPDPRARDDVRSALMQAYIATEKRKEAMVEARAILAKHPELQNDTQMRYDVRNAALLGEEEAYAVLESAMGKEGWDILYDVAYGESGSQYPKAQKRAAKSLEKGERVAMSPALQVALEVRNAAAQNACNVRAHLDRAAKDGDERTLVQLKVLQAPRMVGHFRKKDALACLHKDTALSRAIGAIQSRRR
jgi:eukaryotic-like serine/threonine-protein kinase